MNLVAVSEREIALAINRLLANEGTCGDIEAAAAWAVANYERVQKLRNHMVSMAWGLNGDLDTMLDEVL